tara:strand:+ start:228 stop:638 length:411 start_codon:yes stop_codon:yes gene_type:complete
MKDGAGFIVYRKFEDKILFLGLKGPEFIRKRSKGTWDIPKGIKEPGESDWACAVRECWEEAGIDIDTTDRRSGPLNLSRLTIFLVETHQDPFLQRNPMTGINEHEDYEWLTPGEIEGDCYYWLQPAIIWARTHLGI